MHRSLLVAGLVIASLVGGATARAASIWAPVNSGTTQNITALDYQSDARVWFATAGGQIFHRDAGGTFVQALSAPGVSFTDVAFQPGGGQTGLAVANGFVYRSTDGGLTWLALSGLPAAGLPLTVRTSCNSATTVPFANAPLYGISWGDANTAYIVGGGTGTQSVILKTTNGAASFSEVNWTASGCLAGSGTDAITDVWVQPGAPNFVTVIEQSFGKLTFSSNGFTSTGAPGGELINNFDGSPRIAVDPSNPNRIWAVDQSGSTCGSLCFQFTEDKGSSQSSVAIDGDPTVVRSLWGVTFAGGTLVAVGNAGEIFTSIDGRTAFLQRADGALATTDWRAASAFDSTHAMVAGSGGALVATTRANSVPDRTAPTGSISGPASTPAGVAVTFTASLADNAGGSGIDAGSVSWTTPGFPAQSGTTATYTFPASGTHTLTLTFKDVAGNTATVTKTVTVTAALAPSGSNPKSTSTGGAVITIYRTVRITGRNGRYIPVRLKAKGRRTFRIRLYRGTSERAISSLKVTIARKGVRLAKLPLPATAGPGRYRVVVQVFKGKRRVGRQVRVAIVVA